MLLFGLRRISASEVGFCHAPREEGRKTELRPDLGWHTAPPAVRRLFANIADGNRPGFTHTSWDKIAWSAESREVTSTPAVCRDLAILSPIAL
jgi:hypothetical protein